MSATSKQLIIPSKAVTVLPMNLTAPDAQKRREEAGLQFELAGISQDAHPQARTFTVIPAAQVNGITQWVGMAMHQDQLPEWNEKELQSAEFIPLAWTRPLKESALHIWEEDDKTILCITSEKSGILALQPLSASEPGDMALSEIRCLLAEMDLLDIPLPYQFVGPEAWHDTADSLALAFHPALASNAAHPDLPDEARELVPDKARFIRHANAKRKRWMTLLGLVFLAILGYFGFRTFQLNERQLQMDVREQKVKLFRPQLLSLMTTSREWDELDAAINPQTTVVENLQKVLSQLPDQGVRFTSFNMTNGLITIQGEAANTPTHTNFMDQVKKISCPPSVTWSFPSPTLERDQRVKFTFRQVKSQPSSKKTP